MADLIKPESKENYKCSSLLLTVFIKVRMLDNLTDQLIMPNKGEPHEIRSGNIGRKTKGPLMIALAYNYRARPIIGTAPTLPEIETPPLFIPPPKVIKSQQDGSKVNEATMTLNWGIDLGMNVISILKSQK